MFNHNTKNPAEADSLERIFREFVNFYSPYKLPDFKFTPRNETELPPVEKSRADQLKIIARDIDNQRGRHPYSGAGAAGREMYAQLIDTLRTEKGVHAETLLAVIGTLGGYNCMKGIMTAFNSVIAQGNSLAETGNALSIYVAETKTGEKYLFGDLVGNEFCLFCANALKEKEPPLDILNPLSALAAQQVGSADYWKTPYDGIIGKSLKELLETFKDKFDWIFKLFCVYPQEPMLAMSVCANLALEQIEAVLEGGRTTAVRILAEYGWRTSHFIG